VSPALEVSVAGALQPVAETHARNADALAVVANIHAIVEASPRVNPDRIVPVGTIATIEMEVVEADPPAIPITTLSSAED